MVTRRKKRTSASGQRRPRAVPRSSRKPRGTDGEIKTVAVLTRDLPGPDVSQQPLQYDPRKDLDWDCLRAHFGDPACACHDLRYLRRDGSTGTTLDISTS